MSVREASPQVRRSCSFGRSPPTFARASALRVESGRLSAALENLQERAGLEIRLGQAGRLRFRERDRSAAEPAEEEIQQSLTGRGVVEYVADQSRLGGFVDEILQPCRGRFQALKEEKVYRHVAAGKLRRMQVPALVEAADERVLDMIEMHLPRAVNGLSVLLDLAFE